jgi:hypothetical protein
MSGCMALYLPPTYSHPALWPAGIGACAPFQNLMRKVVKVAPIKEKYEQVGGHAWVHVRVTAVLLLVCCTALNSAGQSR